MENNKNRKLSILFLISSVILLIVSLCISFRKLSINPIPFDNFLKYEEENNTEYVLLAINDTYDINYVSKINMFNKNIRPQYSSLDENIATIDENGTIKAIAPGKTTIKVSLLNFEDEIEIETSDLICKMDYEESLKKEYLKENTYTNEENAILDKYLEYRINEAGYNTRAGVVAAARFLTLELPYRIEYFAENGRVTNGIDGEGRYYHKGLYLSESKYDSLEPGKTLQGPKYWGEMLGHACWQIPTEETIDPETGEILEILQDRSVSYYVDSYCRNGLDCSGFIAWALYNAGFDCGEIGAGFSNMDDYHSFLTIAKYKYINEEVLPEMKAGDLVHNDLVGGHIGMLIGIDGDTYYVAQAIWYDTSGVVVTKYNKEEFIKNWLQVVLMDEYYKESGNYTAMW